MKAVFPGSSHCRCQSLYNYQSKYQTCCSSHRPGKWVHYSINTGDTHTALVGAGREINNISMTSERNSFLPWLQVFPVYPGWHLHLFGPTHSPCLHPGWHIAANRGILIIFPLQSQLTVLNFEINSNYLTYSSTVYVIFRKSIQNSMK